MNTPAGGVTLPVWHEELHGMKPGPGLFEGQQEWVRVEDARAALAGEWRAVAYRWRSAGPDAKWEPMHHTPGEFVGGKCRHLTHPDARLEYAYAAPLPKEPGR